MMLFIYYSKLFIINEDSLYKPSPVPGGPGGPTGPVPPVQPAKIAKIYITAAAMAYK